MSKNNIVEAAKTGVKREQLQDTVRNKEE